jgi:hypothetical protein
LTSCFYFSPPLFHSSRFPISLLFVLLFLCICCFFFLSLSLLSFKSPLPLSFEKKNHLFILVAAIKKKKLTLFFSFVSSTPLSLFFFSPFYLFTSPLCLLLLLCFFFSAVVVACADAGGCVAHNPPAFPLSKRYCVLLHNNLPLPLLFFLFCCFTVGAFSSTTVERKKQTRQVDTIC